MRTRRKFLKDAITLALAPTLAPELPIPPPTILRGGPPTIEVIGDAGSHWVAMMHPDTQNSLIKAMYLAGEQAAAEEEIMIGEIGVLDVFVDPETRRQT